MKRQYLSLEQIADYSNLVRAFHKAAKGKRYRRDVQAFLANFNRNIHQLSQSVLEQKMPYGHFRAFTIYDPKQRTIHAACFEDRIFHHAVMNLAGHHLESAMSPFSYACRPNKGVHKAVKQVQKNLQRFKYFGKVDISGYFAAIDHDRLMQVLQRRYTGQATRKPQTFSGIGGMMELGKHSLRGVQRVLRGGSWNNNGRNCRSAIRNHNDADNRNNNVGFRLSLAQHRIGITVKDQRFILFCSFRANKKQGRPHVSSTNERVWDDRLQVPSCKH